MRGEMLYEKMFRGAAENRGATAVEFALVAPVVLLLLVATASLALGAYKAMALESAARAAAQYAFYLPRTEVATLQRIAEDAAARVGAGVSGAASVSCQCLNGATGGCEATCPRISEQKTYATITLSYRYTLPFEVAGWKELPLEGSAVFRIR